LSSPKQRRRKGGEAVSADKFIRIIINDHETWLKTRQNFIQASDAPSVCNCSPWKDKTVLWDEKKGLVKAKDIGNKPHVLFGKKMEPLIREQFLLDNPYFSCDYHEYDILVSKERKWQGCTLDGELTVTAENPWNLPIGSKGPLEVKTGSFKSYDDYKEWRLFPMNYYVQIMHQLSVTGWDFVMTASRIKRDPFKESDFGFPEIHTLYHLFLRSDPQVQQDIEIVEERETEFKQSLDSNKRPALTLSL
jgi:predicted phage-related endonuclease